ncbi:aldo/keto reductase [Hymenobacter sp. BT491]|uniref:aldo/keto reductase n=1 Tax=Hymenobacter sp. BT491 TaxID=2766779 RepID=UPI0016535366|nr:aldo/keto reductase [Hymenobacter sp. BT491]MBC6991340.1 aldo/keto reductase [Hymenobacter sp. BT491]
MANTTAPAFPATYSLGGDLNVNRMGYGAMRITGEGIWGPPQDHDESIRVLQRAVELGINFIDTADSYGPNVSEELIAEALHPYAIGLVIATKGGLLRTGPNQWPINAHPDHMREALEGSLQRLKLDQIDLYQLHRVDPEVPFEDTLEFLQKAQEDGLVKHIGLSEVTVEQIQKAQEYVPVVSVQNMYSVDNRKWEAELNYCEQNNMAFIPWYPLSGGNTDALARLDRIGQKYDASRQQIALSWLLHRSPNILLIPGTSKVKHLEENYKAVSISLSEEDMAELEKLSDAQ